ncbi:hypothetical protein SOVF_118950 [Spinacia oleracea]|uniref:Uncharacterized protein n=1 Tax=Spinacia oleracea TaxID=3562 RepID=A0A9R0JXS3_SPIOL|nr:uncharacterized protein LOC110790565 [Spinacia oleracea]KNA13174.1 hypothetical protein SOVF_118950 [Spinacia oleracea]
MGSLMAGWDCLAQDPKYVKLMRNKSLTKNGIEDYWKLKKKTEDEHLKAISPDLQERLFEECGSNELKRTNSLPIIGRKSGKLMLGKESDADPQHLKNGWWTRSNWAFLNEPPVIQGEVPNYKYASQYHIATLASTN